MDGSIQWRVSVVNVRVKIVGMAQAVETEKSSLWSLPHLPTNSPPDGWWACLFAGISGPSTIKYAYRSLWFSFLSIILVFFCIVLIYSLTSSSRWHDKMEGNERNFIAPLTPDSQWHGRVQTVLWFGLMPTECSLSYRGRAKISSHDAMTWLYKGNERTSTRTPVLIIINQSPLGGQPPRRYSIVIDR